MKKVYSTIMMLTMMVAALSFTACGDDEDDDNPNGGGDYIQVTLDGKTYSDKILNWHYAQVDPVGEDENGKPLTFTYDMYEHFEDDGFSFMFGVVHYSRNADLLASPTGNYGCAKDILSDDFYKNLTFSPSLDIDYHEYEWKSGTHQVKSIKEVNGKVQLEAEFTSKFEYKGNNKTVKGKYRITIP